MVEYFTCSPVTPPGQPTNSQRSTRITPAQHNLFRHSLYTVRMQNKLLKAHTVQYFEVMYLSCLRSASRYAMSSSIMALSVFHLSERTVIKPYLICFGDTLTATVDLPAQNQNHKNRGVDKKNQGNKQKKYKNKYRLTHLQTYDTTPKKIRNSL